MPIPNAFAELAGASTELRQRLIPDHV